MIISVEKLSSQYSVRPLTEADIDRIYELCRNNPLYYKHCPPPCTREGIFEDLKALPPGKDYADKYYIGFFENKTMIAVMDLIASYPDEGTAFIGLFMMNKEYQGRGTGSRIIHELCSALQDQGFSSVRLGYVKTNPQSKRFWEKNQFIPTGAIVRQELYDIVVMQRLLMNAIIFDLDGTLWDATDCACTVLNQVAARYDQNHREITKAQIDPLMGKPMDEFGRILFPGFSEAMQQRIIEEFGREEADYLKEHGAVLYDGLEETLKKLQGNYRLFIVSNCQDGYIQAFLQAHKLEAYFEDIEMFGRTGLPKSGSIRVLMERNHIQSAVYVGDTAGDEEASRTAGIPFIYAAYGLGQAAAPDGVIAKIADLPEVLAHWQDRP